MVAENKFVPASGTDIGIGSVTFNQTLLFGMSGGVAIPIQVDSSGALVTV